MQGWGSAGGIIVTLQDATGGHLCYAWSHLVKGTGHAEPVIPFGDFSKVHRVSQARPLVWKTAESSSGQSE